MADVLGNFANRTLSFCASKFGPTVPAGGVPGAKETKLAEELERRFGLYSTYLEEVQFRKAAAELRGIWVLGNEYLAEGAPWTAIREDKAKAALVIRTAINLIRLFAILSAPIIPFTSTALMQSLKLDPASIRWPQGLIADELKVIAEGAAIEGRFAFTKILPEQVAEWEVRFGGASS
jgi:methionyl-tRNA synthetase